MTVRQITNHARVVQQVARLPFPAGDRGSIPAHALHFTPVDMEAANSILAAYHYLGPAKRHRHVFGAWLHDELVACQVYASPTARLVPREWLELTRWCITPQAPKNAGSQQMAWVRRWMARNAAPVTLVSYSELGRHSGALYAASGWQQSPTHHALRYLANGKGYPSGHGTWGTDKVQPPKMRWLMHIDPPKSTHPKGTTH